MDDGRDPGCRTDEFSDRLAVVADFFAETVSHIQALNLYELAVTAALVEAPDPRFFRSVCTDLAVCGRAEQGFITALHGTVRAGVAGRVMRIWEQAARLDLPQECVEAGRKEMAWFADTYKYRDVEFRRRDGDS